MTNLEYNDLKYKIVTRHTAHRVFQLMVVFCVAALASTFTPLVFATMDRFLQFLTIFALGMIYNEIIEPYTKKHQQLSKLFKNNASYEEALKELELQYEPPKD